MVLRSYVPLLQHLKRYKMFYPVNMSEAEVREMELDAILISMFEG